MRSKEKVMRTLLLPAAVAMSVFFLGKTQLRAVPPPEPQPATILVNLPTVATLTIDDHPTISLSSPRLFVTPPLQPGRTFYYTFLARIVRDGKSLIKRLEVPVRAGQQTLVTMDFSAFRGTESPTEGAGLGQSQTRRTSFYPASPEPGWPNPGAGILTVYYLSSRESRSPNVAPLSEQDPMKDAGPPGSNDPLAPKPYR
jgi:uncharacterized protein (TIGR03000 family)